MKKSILSTGILFLSVILLVVPCYNAQNVSKTVPMDKGVGYSFPDIGQTVVWDNGMDFDDGHPSQRDESYPFEAITADDFQFETETTVTDAYWFGILSQAEDKDFDMELNFYYDRGDGNAPGEIYEGPIYFLNKDTNETLIEGTYGLKYTYNASFPEPIIFEGNVHYWISIQAIGQAFPQWYVGASNNKYQLHECVFKFELLGFPEWTDGFDGWGSHDDVCFQLVYRENSPPSAPVIDGPFSGSPNIEYYFTFHSTDPDNDMVKYLIDWGDDNMDETSWFPSCEPVGLYHTFAEGNYTIRAMAIDEWGAESNISEFEINIPRSRVTHSLLTRILEQYPLLEVLLEIIVNN